MLFYRYAIFLDIGPSVKQHLVNILVFTCSYLQLPYYSIYITASQLHLNEQRRRVFEF